MHALICGAGVGGLSAGIALQRKGFDVTVFERASDLRTTGVGLNLWPNAGRALYALGLRNEYDAISVQLKRYLTLSSTGETLFEMRVDDWHEKYGAAATGVYRPSLSEMLAKAVGERQIQFGYELASLEQRGSKVVCVFTNGETHSGDLMIGADGIHSTTRSCLYGPPKYQPSDHYAYRWRGLVRLEDIAVDPWAETEVFGDESFVGTMPIGSGLAYWFASGPGIERYEDFIARFGLWRKSHVPSTIDATMDGEILQTRLYDLLEPPDQWTSGRVTLLGDAAHPMMPDMAQGASQAFVDSMVLGECLSPAGGIEEALRQYEERRRPEAYRIVRLSRRGMFSDRDRASAGRGVDPIALRYERDVEGLG